MELAEFEAHLKSSLGDSRITVVRVDVAVRPVRLLDAACDDVEALLPRYGTVLQSIRMVDCHGRNTWQPQPREWSTAALDVNTRDRLLLLNARSPYRTHDFVQVVQQLPHRRLPQTWPCRARACGPSSLTYVSLAPVVKESLGQASAA